MGSPGGGEGPSDTDPPTEAEEPDSLGGGPARCGTVGAGGGGSDSWDAGVGPIPPHVMYQNVVESCVSLVPPSTLKNAFGLTDPSYAGHAGGMGVGLGLPPQSMELIP